MTPNETTQLRTMAEMFRRLRKENAQLRESLGMETKEGGVVALDSREGAAAVNLFPEVL